jgi:hypothetical protein
MLLTITTRIAEPDIPVVEIEGRILLGRECTHVGDTVVKAIDDGARNIVVDLAGAHGVVLEILKMTHLDSVIPVSATAEEACSKMAAQIQAAQA